MVDKIITAVLLTGLKIRDVRHAGYRILLRCPHPVIINQVGDTCSGFSDKLYCLRLNHLRVVEGNKRIRIDIIIVRHILEFFGVRIILKDNELIEIFDFSLISGHLIADGSGFTLNRVISFTIIIAEVYIVCFACVGKHCSGNRRISCFVIDKRLGNQRNHVDVVFEIAVGRKRVRACLWSTRRVDCL